MHRYCIINSNFVFYLRFCIIQQKSAPWLTCLFLQIDSYCINALSVCFHWLVISFTTNYLREIAIFYSGPTEPVHDRQRTESWPSLLSSWETRMEMEEMSVMYNFFLNLNTNPINSWTHYSLQLKGIFIYCKEFPFPMQNTGKQFSWALQYKPHWLLVIYPNADTETDNFLGWAETDTDMDTDRDTYVDNAYL